MPRDATFPDDTATGFSPWRMLVRDHLNPAGSERLFRIGLKAEVGSPPWRAGDLAEIEMPDGQKRTYSIASVPSEGRLDLLVREVKTPDGTLGRGTAWLLHELRPDDRVKVRVKPHMPFHAPAREGPVLLVGAGSGLAGLRPHILEAAGEGRAVWLVYGERHAYRDNRLCRELHAWHQGGKLYRFNLAISQGGQGLGSYVQDIVSLYATDIRHYMGDAGVIMTCGGVAMGHAVEQALRQALGDAWIDAALGDLRYRQALY